MPEALIAFRRAEVTIGGRRVVGPLDLDVREGETVVCLGASGSGKTTTLRLVNALVRPSGGSVAVRGRQVADWDVVTLRRGVGYVIQDIGLLPHWDVAANIGVIPRLLGWSTERIRARVRELLELMGLDPGEFAARRPHELSGGQRQRVGVARALAADPPILLCDEPFGAVDPLTRADLQREFHRLSRRLGKTVLFVTHDVREALQLGDRVVLLEEGQPRFVGTPDTFRRADDPVVRAFNALA